MHIFYIDDSYDRELCVFSAMALPVDQWRQAYQQVRDWRQSLQRTFGIDTQKGAARLEICFRARQAVGTHYYQK